MLENAANDFEQMMLKHLCKPCYFRFLEGDLENMCTKCDKWLAEQWNAMMRKAGLDPANPNHAKGAVEYLEKNNPEVPKILNRLKGRKN